MRVAGPVDLCVVAVIGAELDYSGSLLTLSSQLKKEAENLQKGRSKPSGVRTEAHTMKGHHSRHDTCLHKGTLAAARRCIDAEDKCGFWGGGAVFSVPLGDIESEGNVLLP